MDMETADIFNLSLPNQKSYDNNTMDLSLSDLKLFDGLDHLDGGAPARSNGTSGGDDVGDAAAAIANGNCNGGSSSSSGGGSSCNGGSGNHLLTTFGTKEATMNGSGGGGLEDPSDEHRSSSRTSSIGLNDGGSGEDHDLMDGALEDDGRSLSGDPDQDCKICKTPMEGPRLLSCLHSFCLPCLESLMVGESKRDAVISCPICQQTTTIGAPGPMALHPDYMLTNIVDLNAVEPKSLACTSCKSKDEAVSRCNDCASFLCDACDKAHKYMRCFENHVVMKLEDLRGSDEKVVIHKPLFCQLHSSEMLKYYCFSCQTVVCNDCLVVEHKGIDHHCELIVAAQMRVRTELEELVTSAQSKVSVCHATVTKMNNSLTELQGQHDVAHDTIESNYNQFKVILEKCRERALRDLEQLHSERELKIMDAMHVVEKATQRIQSTCKFAGKVLQQANGPELLSLKQLITNQVHHSLQNTPKIERSYSLEFESKAEKFEALAHDTFGRFRTEVTHSPKESTPPPTLPGMPPMLSKSTAGSIGAMTGSHTASSPISMPTSMQSSFDGDMLGGNFMMPTAGISPEQVVQSQQQQQQQQQQHPMPQQHNQLSKHSHDFIKLREQQIAANNLMGNNQSSTLVSPNNINPTTLNGLVPNVPPPPNGTNISGLSSIAEYNIHCLANLVDNHPQLNQPPPQHHFQPPQQQQQQQHQQQQLHRHNSDHLISDDSNALVSTNGMVVPSTVTAPSPGPQFTLADLISGDQRAFSQSLQALAKLNMNGNGPSAINRGPSPGINGPSNIVDNSSMLSDYVSLAGSTSPIGTIGDDMGSISSMSMAGTMYMPGRTKATPMQIRCKFGSLGASKAQFNSPHGFCLGVDEEIIVADTNNHRIEVFEKNGTFKFQFGVPGKEEGQLWYPRKVAVMRTSGKFVVCDRGNERSRMQIFTKNGHFMKKIAIRYIDIVAGLAMTNQGHIVAVDSVSPSVFIISEDGVLVHWFDCSDYMREPSDIAISGTDFYVCDFKGHNVVVFNESGVFQHRIGDEKITCFPNGIDISDAGDILIGDSHGNRFHVACFSRSGELQSEFECPYVKVSRCCGLKITSKGYVVTLAKNNHHVLVLNTLYIQ